MSSSLILPLPGEALLGFTLGLHFPCNQSSGTGPVPAQGTRKKVFKMGFIEGEAQAFAQNLTWKFPESRLRHLPPSPKSPTTGIC